MIRRLLAWWQDQQANAAHGNADLAAAEAQAAFDHGNYQLAAMRFEVAAGFKAAAHRHRKRALDLRMGRA